MKYKLPSHFIFGLLVILTSCAGKNTVESQSTTNSKAIRVMPSGGCEDCELMFAGMPDILNSIDTTAGWNEPGQKLKITGQAFHLDGKTPAENVILYYYHTDQKGYYSPGDLQDAGARRHGRLRGWVKTGKDGVYQIYTSRPAQYPSNNTEAHIHLVVKEPDLDQPYWIDAWVFDDDPLLTPALRNRLENRGGSGIMQTKYEGDLQVAHQNIILGLNVPGYPERKN